jgi:ligand-binding sensor domain-containing protein
MENPTGDGLTGNLISCVYEDGAGNLWIGTDTGGLNRLKDSKFTTYTGKDGLSSDMVWTVCEDGYGNLWIGTEASGLNHLDPQDGKITSYIKPWKI